jgi:hypothetical protein
VLFHFGALGYCVLEELEGFPSLTKLVVYIGEANIGINVVAVEDEQVLVDFDGL